MSLVNANKTRYISCEINGIPAIFIDLRIDRKTVPEELFTYDVRHADDDWGAPVTIEEHVLVNHYGTLLTAKELCFGNKDYLSAEEHDLENGEHLSLQEFLAEVGL